ncbi:MAG: (d)CMP kinase [Victivallales bacterium]|nr:(d)CMP kinase [Victivallales bacterium]
MRTNWYRREIMAQPVIAIDGPAASGKSTVASMLAARLHVPYVNTGNMFRAVTLYAADCGIDFSRDCNDTAFSPLLRKLELKYELNVDGDYELRLNGNDSGSRLRSPEIAALASRVAAIPAVREYLKRIQREAAKLGLIVMEGRDIGTVVFPDAEYKFFLTATPEERARRRLAQSGETFDGATLESVTRDIAERDRIDSSRELAPLKPAADAEIVDTTRMTIEEAVEYLAGRIKHGRS